MTRPQLDPKRRTLSGEARGRRVLGVLTVVALATVVAFGTIGLTGNLEYALGLRLRKVAAMIVVGVAVGYSSVLFQTVTNNRILTPRSWGSTRCSSSSRH